MSPRSSVAPVMASGTASAVKLLVATLAFAGAYLGVEATYGTPAQVPAGAAAQEPVRTVELSSRSMPATERVSAAGRVPAADETSKKTTDETADKATGTVTDKTEDKATGKVTDTVTEKAATRGAVTVTALDALGPCDRLYQARSVVDNADPRAAVSYGWHLERWSPGTRRWQTYLGTGSGFGGESQTVEWQPRIVDNPGWYRVVLSVSGDAPLRSEKFLVGC
ncbi:hypothetical protein [Streptosporangium sp. NPDC002524]|uniref:hypothetical protein n=1 Tax=Streptosporangium sp. NPDC002524 TaxID=3154537 RepID=UPI003331206B